MITWTGVRSIVIDLRRLSDVRGSTHATLSGTTLAVNDGTSSVTLHLAPTQPKSSVTTASDGPGGTLVYDSPATSNSSKHASTAKVDRHWTEMAMADFGGVAGGTHGQTLPHDPYGLAAPSDFASHGGEGRRFVKQGFGDGSPPAQSRGPLSVGRFPRRTDRRSTARGAACSRRRLSAARP